MPLINHNAEIEDTVFNVLTSLETIVQTVIGDQTEPPGGAYDVRVMRQNAVNCYPQTDLHYPPYKIRLRRYEEKFKAAAAYEFAHELCHVWLGVAPSSALAEIICECASWYFLLELQNETGIPYYNDTNEPYQSVHPDLDDNNRMIIPLEYEPLDPSKRRRAMVLLAKNNLVPWIVANPVFWKLLPQIGRAMGGGDPAIGEVWSNNVDWDVIINGLSTDPERNVLQSFRATLEEFAVFQ